MVRHKKCTRYDLCKVKILILIFVSSNEIFSNQEVTRSFSFFPLQVERFFTKTLSGPRRRRSSFVSLSPKLSPTVDLINMTTGVAASEWTPLEGRPRGGRDLFSRGCLVRSDQRE